MWGVPLHTVQSVNQSLFANAISSKQQKEELWQAARTGNSLTKLVTSRQNDRHLM